MTFPPAHVPPRLAHHPHLAPTSSEEERQPVETPDAAIRTPKDLEAHAATVLVCRGLSKSFGDHVAVRDVSFTIGAGETYGLLGPNGAGKTTTISMIAGLLEPDAGEVLIAGRPMTSRSIAVRDDVGYVPQELAIYPELTGRENLTFFARMYGMRRAAAKDRVEEILRVIGLEERAKDRAKEYSGGMKRRLNIGIGLLHRPKLLILDEPTAGVDPQSRNSILEAVGKLSEEGMAVLYTTHYMEEAERLCDRVGIIDLGELKAEGSQRELVALVGEHDRVRLTVGSQGEAAVSAVRGMAGVLEAGSSDGSVDLIVNDAQALLPKLLQKVGSQGVSVTGVDVTEPNLEAVFLHLTGKALRN
jgi:ABC-2 type transport system ATP-binding protein